MDPNIFILLSQVARDNPGQTQGKTVHTWTILTTEANGLMQPIHERMPVILGPSSEEQWLDPRASPDMLCSLLVPYAGDELRLARSVCG
jgi:putative SOS response-associated peptidase YedK